jgi:choline dehydrogenase-like flavoprotein
MLSKSYDFIIIGGGTAGLALANRLTENPDTNVLVLEAGLARLEVSEFSCTTIGFMEYSINCKQDPKINIPALFSQLYEEYVSPFHFWSCSFFASLIYLTLTPINAKEHTKH